MKRILGWILVSVLLVAIPVVYATSTGSSRKVKDAMTFAGTVTMTGAETHSGAVTYSGVVTNNDGVYFNNEVVMEPFKLTSVASATSPAVSTWAYSNGNIAIFSGATPYNLTMPAITATMSGYVFIVKNESSGVSRIITVATGDNIEAAQGTMTGTSDGSVDAAGDVAVWMAIHSDHLAGVSSVWMILSEDLS
jgi:hypothetical protein